MRFFVYRPSVLHVTSLLVVLFFALGVYAVVTFEPRTEIRLLPNIILEDVEGNPAALHELTGGRHALINVWASWCPYCVEELPDFAKLKREYPDLAIVAINRKESEREARAYLEAHGISVRDLTVLLDPQDVFYRAVQGVGMPETLIVNTRGQIVLQRHGPMTFAEMERFVQSLVHDE